MEKQRRIPDLNSILPVVVLGLLVSPVAFAQTEENSGFTSTVINSSNSPVRQLLVGDINVAPNSPEARVGLAIENLCPQLAFRQQQSQNSAIQTDLLQRCGDLTFDETPQTSNLRQVASEEMATQETDIVEFSFQSNRQHRRSPRRPEKQYKY